MSWAEVYPGPAPTAHEQDAADIFLHPWGRPSADSAEETTRVTGQIDEALEGTNFNEANAAPSSIGDRLYEDEEANQLRKALAEAGLSQIAYMAGDLAAYGYILPGTRLRTRNELIGTALEKLGKPFVKSFSYRLEHGELVAEDGESLGAIDHRGVEQARAEAKNNPQLSFLVKRFEADVDLHQDLRTMATDESVPVGTTVIVGSASPNAKDLRVPEWLLKFKNYRPDVDMAVTWIGTKTSTGITLTTINLFHASPERLNRAIETVTDQSVPACDRESTPWQRNWCFDPSSKAAKRMVEAFDEISSEERGEPTLHGLTYAEAASETTAESFIADPEFQRTLLATEQRLGEAAESIVTARLIVPPEYLQAIMQLRKPDGTFELENYDRLAVDRTISLVADEKEFIAAMRAVHVAATATLWAKISQIYHGEKSEWSLPITATSADNVMISMQELHTILAQRLAGRVEFGCPGGGLGGILSIFDMTPGQLAEAMLGNPGKKTDDNCEFVSRQCPECGAKNVKTKVTKTLITGSCGCKKMKAA